jgi:periplasmic protein TonB
MNSLLYFTQIATLALWLSVTGFGALGLKFPHQIKAPTPPKVEEPKWDRDEITLGDTQAAETSEAVPLEVPEESVPTPPELPPIAEFTPLPEIPDLPVPEKTPQIAPFATKPVPRQTSPPKPTSTARTSSSGVKTNSTPSTNSTARAGVSEASRLSAGKMQKPSYPSEAKRKNQTGTVIVEFTVDASGQVISAYAKTSSGWPLLDSEAVRTVRRWSFPPGGIMKLQRPIVFRLQ